MLAIWCVSVRADSNVVVSSFANPDYTQQKYSGQKIRPETYVIAQGQYFESQTIDHSIDRMPFQRILDFFAPELARRQYWPAKGVADADLLIVVHWGTTTRTPTTNEMRARDSAVTDISTSTESLAKQQMTAGDMGGIAPLLEASDLNAQQLNLDALDLVAEQSRLELGMATTAQLLGYSRDLRKLTTTMGISTAESMLKSDLSSERYFIILKAYPLHTKIPMGKAANPVWTLHLNMRSPGINFRVALDRMSATAPDYFGRTTDGVVTVPSRMREGKVEVGTPVVVGEKKK